MPGQPLSHTSHRIVALLVSLAACGGPDQDAEGPDAADPQPTSPGVIYSFGGQQKLLPTQAGASLFGHAVAIDGNTLVAGALVDNQLAAEAGAAYVFVRNGATWSLQQKLLGDGLSKDRFGKSVDISGNTVVVGVPVAGNADAAQNRNGAAHVFVRSGTTWSLQQKIGASDGAINDRFGQTVRIDGDRLIVSRYKDASARGAVYIYERSGGVWGSEAKLVATDGLANDEFGYFVDIQGNVAVVGARRDDIGTNADQGSVYVFNRVGLGNWTQVKKLTASDGAAGDFFGRAVALSGNTLLASAMRANGSRGSAYVFEFNGTTWNQQQKLTASDGSSGDEYGKMVALEGNTAAIGSYRDDGPFINQGSVYVYKRTGSVWTEDQLIRPSDAAANDEFGKDVALSNGTVVVGAHLADPVAVNSGAAYVFEGPKLITGADFGGADLIPNNGDTLSGTFTNVGTFKVPAGATVTVAAGVPLQVSATTTIIDGTLDANGAGSAGGAGVGAGASDGSNGSGPGGGGKGRAGPCVHGGGGGGGGYGGAGGTGGYAFNDPIYPNPGVIYGSDTDTAIELGSGGGGGGSSCSDASGNGGAGGGSIRISGASIQINGVISANGVIGAIGPVDGGAGGGGSGGSVGLFSSTITGAGVVNVKGGTGGSEQSTAFEGDGGGGGGGKVKLGAAAPFTIAVTGGAAGGPCTGGSATCPAVGNAGKVLVIGPKLTANPSPVAFGSVRVGQASSGQILHLVNTGGGDLTISAISTAAPFAVSGLPILPVTLIPNAEVTLTVTFTPTVTGATNGSVTVVSNDPAGPTAAALTGTGIAPAIAVDQTSIDFGNQRVTTTGNRNLKITNTGTDTLIVSSISVTGVFAAPTAGFSLAPGASQTIQLSFSPIATGAANGSLTINSDAATSPTNVALVGNGIAPAISVDQVSIDFLGQRVGTTGNRNLKITNTGTDTLNVSAVSTTGAFAAPASGFSLTPNAFKTIVVSFTPTATGPFNGSLTITSDAATSPTGVTLAGTGIAPAIAVDQTSIDFGNQRVGTTGNRGLVITNVGSDTLSISTVVASGVFSAPNSPIVLAPSASVTVTVGFTPTATGPAVGNVTITSDAGNGPTTVVGLSGNGIAPAISVQASLDFGDRRVGTTANLPLVVTNSGTDTLNISAISAGGDFADADTVPISIAPNATATLTVSFTPTAVGPRAANLTITSDAATSPTIVPLKGNGIAPAIAVASSLVFANQRINTTGSKILTISNTGTDTLNVTSITATAPFSNTTTTPFSIAAGNSLDVTVDFTPTALGPVNGNLTIVSDAATSPTSVSLSGTGIAPAISTVTAIDFGDQRVGTTGNRNFVVTNTGTDTLTISAIATTGPFANTDSVPISLAPNATATLTVSFTPSATGPAVGTLTITSDASTSPTPVDLLGNGIAPAITAPTSLAFGFQRVNTLSASRQVTVTNTGTDDLKITALAVGAPFAISSSIGLPATISPTGSLAIDLTFFPTVVGAAGQTLTITSDAATSPTTIDLSGIGVVPGLTPSTMSFGFGTVKVGSTSVGQQLTLSNTGLTSAVISGIAMPPQFQIAGPALPISLLPDASVTLTVTFVPTTNGSASGSITFTSDAPTVPVIQLDGVGGTPQLTADPPTLEFGAVPVGTTSDPLLMTLHNPGTSPLVINAVTTADPFIRASLALPITIEPGGSFPVNVVFHPTHEGGSSGPVTIVSDGGMVVVPLIGEGLGALSNPGGCCSSTSNVSSSWLGLIVFVLLRRRKTRA